VDRESSDGKRALSGSSDKTIKLWNTETGQLIRSFEGHAKAIKRLVISPDGSRVLSGSEDGAAKLWDATTGQSIRDVDRIDLRAAAFSPDGPACSRRASA
jgi:WD40 repeat protein